MGMTATTKDTGPNGLEKTRDRPLGRSSHFWGRTLVTTGPTGVRRPPSVTPLGNPPLPWSRPGRRQGSCQPIIRA